MAGKPKYDWPADDELVDLVAGHPTSQAAADALGIPRPTLESRLGTRGLTERVQEKRRRQNAIADESVVSDVPPVEAAPPGGLVVVSETQPDPGDIDRLLRERDLDPAQWVVTSATVNEWQALAPESQVVPLRQLKATIQPLKLDRLILPARPDGGYRRRNPPTVLTPADRPRLVVFLPDPHAPFHDPELHALVCRWLAKNRPAEVGLLGDLLDLPKPSRHRETPEWTVSVQQCIDTGYRLLRDYVQAAPKAHWWMLPGNHDIRIRTAVIEHLRSVYGLRRAAAPDEPDGDDVLSLPHLLRLDELGVEYVDPGGEYAQGQKVVTPKLAARHGWIARKGSGASALETLRHLGYSVVVGHTHRQGVVFRTTHDITGDLQTLTAVEAGTLARVEGGLGYAVQPDWQQGFATADVWPDGRFRIDLATYVGGSLLWRNQRWDVGSGDDAA